MWDASFSTSTCRPATCRVRAAARGKEIAQQNVSDDQFLDQGPQLGKARRHRKQLFFLGGKMKCNFLFEDLLDLRLPCFQIDIARLDGAIQAHAQRQAVLVLVGKRNQVLVSKHVSLLSAQPSHGATRGCA